MADERFACYSAIKPPEMNEWKFLDELQSWHGKTAPPGKDIACWKNGVKIKMLFPDPAGVLSTVFPVLSRMVECRGGKISADADAFSLELKERAGLDNEEFIISITGRKITLRASDPEGMRRAVYALEDKILSITDGKLPGCSIRRKPWIRNRISRCFFGPTNRPPLCIDELTNDVDYYPEAYLDRLASEGVNGLWLTVYFRDLPSKTFPSYGKDADLRFAKLRKISEKCAKYGIRIFIFFSEPKFFGSGSKQNILDQRAKDLQLDGSGFREIISFCNSSESFADHIRIPVETLFREVPQLGGIINIMFGEDNGSCATLKLAGLSRCKRCAGRAIAEMYRENAEIFLAAMRKYNPDAQFIGWFYTPAQRDDNPDFARQMAEIAEKWPAEASLMLNFESGCQFEQLKKKRIIYDYSLAAIGPSQLFTGSVGRVKNGGAKLQVGCSHENASVPFIPVPGNLYRKYRAMRKLPVTSVMQCWYFGNYPGIMNRAAGRLSFLPFPRSESAFLNELAAGNWGDKAGFAAEAWNNFGKSYRSFPANIAFEWYGPLHNSIAWPWHVMPQNKIILPSWKLDLQDSSGDRIGETLGFHHTLDEAVALCDKMNDLWQRGVDALHKIASGFRNNRDRTADIILSEAIGLQIASAAATLKFYDLREKMFFEKKEFRSELAKLLDEEIARTAAMRRLCLLDSRLGYHPEVENFLFFPEKLAARIKLLQYEKKLLKKLDIFSEEIERYTGNERSDTLSAVADGSENVISNGVSWKSFRKDDYLWFEVSGAENSRLCFELELRRLFPPVRIILEENGNLWHSPWLFREVPEFRSFQRDGVRGIGIPWEFIEIYRRKNYPVRFNFTATADGVESCWVERKKKPGRLLFDDFDPESAGWLFID